MGMFARRLPLLAPEHVYSEKKINIGLDRGTAYSVNMRAFLEVLRCHINQANTLP